MVLGKNEDGHFSNAARDDARDMHFGRCPGNFSRLAKELLNNVEITRKRNVASGLNLPHRIVKTRVCGRTILKPKYAKL